jgi:hypothetical protein
MTISSVDMHLLFFAEPLVLAPALAGSLVTNRLERNSVGEAEFWQLLCSLTFFGVSCACCCLSAYSTWMRMGQLCRCWMSCFFIQATRTTTMSKALA